MKGDYEYAKWASSKSVALVYHWYKGIQLWASCKVRKNHICCVTGEDIFRTAIAFRPVTDANNRMDRISVEGMNKLIEMV